MGENQKKKNKQAKKMTKYDQVAVDDEDEMQELIMASQNTKKPRMTMYIAIFAVVAVIGVVVVIMMGGSDSSTSDVTASEAKNSDYVESSVYKVSIDLSDVEATEEITVIAEVELEGDFDSITDMDEFESAATESLATTFDVDESQIEITYVHEGSIVIDFIVHDVESEDVSSMIQDEIVTIEAIEVDGTDYGVLESAAVEEVVTVEDAIAQSLAESLGIEAEDIDMACDSTSCTYEISEEDLDHLDSAEHGDVVAGAIARSTLKVSTRVPSKSLRMSRSSPSLPMIRMVQVEVITTLALTPAMLMLPQTTSSSHLILRHPQVPRPLKQKLLCLSQLMPPPPTTSRWIQMMILTSNFYPQLLLLHLSQPNLKKVNQRKVKLKRECIKIDFAVLCFKRTLICILVSIF